MSEAGAPGEKTIELRIVSAQEQIYSGAVRRVSARSANGEVGILPRHSPLMTLLKPGEVRIQETDGEERFIYVSGGMLEVQPFMVTILADTALRGEEIDEQAALEAKRRAEEAISQSLLYTDRDLAYAELLKAMAQLQTLQDARRHTRKR